MARPIKVVKVPAVDLFYYKNMSMEDIATLGFNIEVFEQSDFGEPILEVPKIKKERRRRTFAANSNSTPISQLKLNKKLSEADVEQILVLLETTELPQKVIAKKFCVSARDIGIVNAWGREQGRNVRGFKLNEVIVADIKWLLKNGNIKQGEIARRYGVTIGCITDIARGKTWKRVNAANKEPLPYAVATV